MALWSPFSWVSIGMATQATLIIRSSDPSWFMLVKQAMHTRTALLVTFALVAAVSGAQAKLYGKSHADALKLGEQGWMDFVSTQRDGNSTHGMARAMYFFAEAARGRNDRLIAKLSKTRRAAIKLARATVMKAGGALVNADRIASGGGTIFTTFFPARDVEVEQTFYALLTHAPRAAPPIMTTGNMMREIRDGWTESLLKQANEDNKASLNEAFVTADKTLGAALDACGSLTEDENAICRELISQWLKPESAGN